MRLRLVYKTITKLENDYKDNAVKLNVANDSTYLRGC
jgi:HAE1 family hydrophobic/amphiphilic exporter-1